MRSPLARDVSMILAFVRDVMVGASFSVSARDRSNRESVSRDAGKELGHRLARAPVGYRVSRDPGVQE